MSAHSRAPWRIQKDMAQGGAGISIWEDAGGILAFLTTFRLDSGRLTANEADAALIAAAPDLLAACDRAKADLSEIGANCSCDDGCANCQRVEDATARLCAATEKARGQ